MIAIIATLDTKGDKAGYIKELLRVKGRHPFVIDCGVLGKPQFQPDLSREKVAEAAGDSIHRLSTLSDEAQSMEIMAQGASHILIEMYEEGTLEGVIGVGGTMGSSLFISAVKALPMDVPKVLLSTAIFGPHFPFEEAPSDLMIVPMVSDIWGLSSLSKKGLENAAGAISGAIEFKNSEERLEGKRFIGLTTLGTSTLEYITYIKPLLERRGDEVAVFHVGGGQGSSYEQFVRSGMIKAAFDLCLLDVCPESLSDPRVLKVNDRLKGIEHREIPVIAAPGAVNHFSFGGMPEDLPPVFKGRKMRWHSKKVLQVERSETELRETAKIIASRLNVSKAAPIMVVPKKGFQTEDHPDRRFYDSRRRDVFISALKEALSPRVKYVELDAHINDDTFAQKVIDSFDSLVKLDTRARSAR